MKTGPVGGEDPAFAHALQDSGPCSPQEDHETGSMCDKRNAPAAARPVPEEALVALAGELASVAGGGSVAPAVEPPGGQSGSSSAQFIGLDGDTLPCSSKKRAALAALPAKASMSTPT